MAYQIQVFYQTGNSFQTEDTSQVIELTWESLELAKENLKRIKDHYQMYTELNIRFTRKSTDEILDSYRDKDWFVSDKWMSENCLKLKADNGNEFQLWAFWTGYFETLYSAKIESVTPEETDMEFFA